MLETNNSTAHGPTVSSVPEFSQDLLKRLCRGEVEATEKGYQMAAPSLFSLASKFLSKPLEAEEIIQDSFFAAINYLKTNQADPVEFKVQLVKEVLTRCRSKKERVRITSNQATTGNYKPFQEPVSSEGILKVLKKGPLTAKAFNNSENEAARLHRKQVCQALEKIEPEQKTILELAFFGGYGFKEISRFTGQPLNTVKRLLRISLYNFKAQLEIINTSQTNFPYSVSSPLNSFSGDYSL